jgi:alanine racemase
MLLGFDAADLAARPEKRNHSQYFGQWGRPTCRQAIVGGRRCPVAGRPSMDLLPIDITDLSDPTAARLGQMVTLIGPEIGIDEFAAAAKSTGREVLSHLGSRFHRIYCAI